MECFSVLTAHLLILKVNKLHHVDVFTIENLYPKNPTPLPVRVPIPSSGYLRIVSPGFLGIVDCLIWDLCFLVYKRFSSQTSRWNFDSWKAGKIRQYPKDPIAERQMIGVYNHLLRNDRYLGSMKPFSVSVIGSLQIYEVTSKSKNRSFPTEFRGVSSKEEVMVMLSRTQI